MWITLMIFLLADCLSDIFLIAIGPKTPLSITNHFDQKRFLNLSYIDDLLSFSFSSSTSVILDASFDSFNFNVLDEISNNFGIPYITMTKESENYLSSHRFSAFEPYKTEAAAILSLINYLDLENIVVLASDYQENIKILNFITTEDESFEIKSYFYSKDISQNSLKSLIRKLVKVSSFRSILILDQGLSLKSCIDALKQLKMDEYGKYFLFGTSTIFSIDLEGALILTNQIEKDSNTFDEFIIDVMNTIMTKIKSGNLYDLERSCPGHICLKKLEIINQKNHKMVKIGEYGTKLVLNEDIIFPGNNTSAKVGQIKIKLPILFANETQLGNDFFVARETSKYYYGAEYALQEINSNQNVFEYQLISSNCNLNILDINWYKKCLSSVIKNFRSETIFKGYPQN